MNDPSPGATYLAHVASLIRAVVDNQLEPIQRAGHSIAAALSEGREVHAFGTGHSHMLAEEMFYRAGGLADVRPILFEALMLHASAPLSTQVERLPGLARLLLDDHGVKAADVIVVFSNSGRNTVTTELAAEATSRGLTVIAVTSLAHSLGTVARDGGRRLFEIADIVIDNGGRPGDASVDLTGVLRAVAPTSTAVGAAIANAIVAEAAAAMVAAGGSPRVFASSNVDAGDVINDALLGQS